MILELCSLTDIPKDSMKRVDIVQGEEKLRFCVINLGESVYVIDDRCSHADFSLSEGFLDAEACELECPKHSAVFDIKNGVPKCLPATQPVKTYVTDVVEDKVFIEIEDANV